MVHMFSHSETEECYVCSGENHADTTARGGHKFWSVADARIQFANEPSGAYDVAGAYVDRYIGR